MPYPVARDRKQAKSLKCLRETANSDSMFFFKRKAMIYLVLI